MGRILGFFLLIAFALTLSLSRMFFLLPSAHLDYSHSSVISWHITSSKKPSLATEVLLFPLSTCPYYSLKRHLLFTIFSMKHNLDAPRLFPWLRDSYAMTSRAPRLSLCDILKENLPSPLWTPLPWDCNDRSLKSLSWNCSSGRFRLFKLNNQNKVECWGWQLL